METAKIFGEIGWFPNTAEEFLKQVDGVEAVEIFSPGGDVFEGLEMARIIEERKLKTIGRSFVGSIAVNILLAGSEVIVTEDTILFIHEPAIDGLWQATREDMEQYAKQLAKVEDVIVQGYVRQMVKNGKSSSEAEATVRQWMKDNVFLTAQEAKEAGLVDTIAAPSRAAEAKAMMRAVLKFNDMKLIDKLKEKFRALGIEAEEYPVQTDQAPAVEEPQEVEAEAASKSDEGKPGEAAKEQHAGIEAEAIAAMMAKLEELEKKLAAIADTTNKTRERVGSVEEAAEHLADIVARHLGRPQAKKAKETTQHQSSPFDALAAAFRKT